MGTKYFLTRRQFLKATLGSAAGLATTGMLDAGGVTRADDTSPTSNLSFLTEENFPDVISRRPGIDLTRDKMRLLLVFRENQTTDNVNAFLTPADLVLEDSVGTLPLLSYERINHSKKHFWVRKNQPGNANTPIDQSTYQYLGNSLHSRLYWAGPVHRYPGTKGREGLLCPSPNVLLLKFSPQVQGQMPLSLKKILDLAYLEEVPKRFQYLSPFRYYVLKKIGRQTVYAFQQMVLEGQIPFVEEARFENSPLLDPKMAPPTDPLYGSGNSGQWNLRRIGAEMGWTICSGQDKVVVWVLDDGVDTVDDSSKGLPGPHPDIRFVHPGMDMDTMGTIDVISTRDPAERPEPTHGTNCAGIIGTITNNLDSSGNSNPLGVAGLAGGGLGPAGCNTGCPIYPLVFFSSPVAGPATDAQVAQAFSFATRVHKGGISPDEPGYIAKPLGSVANLSYATGAAWDPAIIDPKIKEAFDAGIVICASTGNSNKNGVGYPASNLYVTACGASDRTDNRVEKANGFVWGSNYGDKLSVVAPGVEIPTTDAQDWPGQQRGNAGGDYDPAFWGTSAAAAHVSGLAALLLSKYPYLTPTQVRTVIEQTASKVGKFATGSPPQYPSMRTNGTWHEEMGYGLINVSEALSYPADVIIRDTLADTGAEPSSGVFWESPDIVIRPNEADPFSDTDVVLKNQDNYLFVRITNNGPGVARNIVVQARIVPYVGTQFTYPYDWQTNSTFVRPEPLTVTYPTIGQGLANQVVAKFKILRADVDTLWDWSNKMWHPCVLAEVTADNDFRHANNLPLIGPGSSTPQRNNLAQRNLTVLSGLPGAMILYPFIMGSAGSSGAKETELHIDRSQVPEHMSLVLDPHHDGAGLPRAGHTQRIGEIIADGEKIMGPLKVKHTHTIVRMQTSPGARYMLALKGEIPKDARRGDTYALRISQRDFKGNPPMGGATLVINVK